MLIDTLGPVIVNAKDSKNRYTQPKRSSSNFISLKNRISFWELELKHNFCLLSSCFYGVGPPCMPQRSLTTWSVSSCSWATTLRSTVLTLQAKPRSWWLQRTAKPTPSVWTPPSFPPAFKHHNQYVHLILFFWLWCTLTQSCWWAVQKQIWLYKMHWRTLHYIWPAVRFVVPDGGTVELLYINLFLMFEQILCTCGFNACVCFLYVFPTGAWNQCLVDIGEDYRQKPH